MPANNCPSCGLVVCFSCEGGPTVCPVCLYDPGDEMSVRNDAPTDMQKMIRLIQTVLTVEKARVEHSNILDPHQEKGWRCPTCGRNDLDCECS